MEADLERLRKRWKRVAWTGGVLLLGPLLGFVGTLLGMFLSFRRIETEKAPAPDALASGVWLGVYAMWIGMLLGAIGCVLLVLALIRLEWIRRARDRAQALDPWH